MILDEAYCDIKNSLAQVSTALLTLEQKQLVAAV